MRTFIKRHLFGRELHRKGKARRETAVFAVRLWQMLIYL